MPKKGFNCFWCKVSSTRAFELEFPTINKCSEVTSILDFYCDRGRSHNRVSASLGIKVSFLCWIRNSRLQVIPAQRRWLVDPFFLAIWYHIRQNRPGQRALTGSEGSRSERKEREWVRRKTREGNLWSDLHSGTDSIGPREALFLSFSRVRLFLLSPHSG